ncbi:hypothetical protein IAU59_006255 [Kwoniella sp. CBS 9459]
MLPPRSAGSKPKPRQVSTSSSASTSSSKGSPAKSTAAEAQIELLYNAAVQSFVRRDHLKTQATLSRLLDTLSRDLGANGDGGESYWYELNEDRGLVTTEDGAEHRAESRGTMEQWLVKSLKLLISSSASLYTDPPSDSALVKTQLPVEFSQSTPGTTANYASATSPDKLLAYLHSRCLDCLYPRAKAVAASPQNGTHNGDSETKLPLLPPQILSTLILASLKLRPSQPALDHTHRICEEWLANLPDSFILAISPRRQYDSGNTSGESSKAVALYRRKVEAAKEGYIKVVELFVGEVLSREGEWEMARGFLDGEVVVPSKRKEALYRHLRSLQANAAQRQSLADSAPSPSSSLVLPALSTAHVGSGNSSDTTRPSRATRHGSRHRTGSTSSTSSSSSERTAKPATGQVGLAAATAVGSGRLDIDRTSGAGIKGKGKAKEQVQGQGNEVHVDPGSLSSSSDRSKLNQYFNRPNPLSPDSNLSRSSTSPRSYLNSALALLPSNASAVLKTYLRDSKIGYALALPLPVILLVTLIVRRRRRLGTTGSTAAMNLDVTDVRNRLRSIRAQNRSWWEWVVYYVRWWLAKSLGIWKLGTTITYV